MPGTVDTLEEKHTLSHKHKLRQTHTHTLNAIPNLRTQKQTPAIRDSPQSPQKTAHREATVTHSQQSTAPSEPEAQLPDSARPKCGPSLLAQNQSGFSVGQFKRLMREREGRRWGSRGGGNAKSGSGGPQPPAEETLSTHWVLTTPGPSTVLSQESEVPPQPALTASCPPP